MAKVMPVGTIRHWKNGDVIKAHEPIKPFSNGWLSLKTNNKFNDIGVELDKLVLGVVNKKEPINGVKFLDHEINKYVNDDGEKVFNSDDFKIYHGWLDAGVYAFRNQLSKMAMQDDLSFDEFYKQRLKGGNEEKCFEICSDCDCIDTQKIYLTNSERKEIKSRSLNDYNSIENKFSEEDAYKLREIIIKTIKKIEQGVQFKDENQKKIYKKFIEVADNLPSEYGLFKDKLKEKEKQLKIIDETFKDNWGIRESAKDYIEKKFEEYVKKFNKRIVEDTLQEQLTEYGVDIDTPVDEFYSTVNNYYLKQNKEKKSELDNGFKYIIHLRFEQLYNKSISGEFDLTHSGVVHNIENLINNLPDGHFITNNRILNITNKDYDGGVKGGYAWYSSNEKRINLSNDLIENSGAEWGVLSNPIEFNSVMLHEIGHAVSDKLGNIFSFDYKKFVVSCGWTYQQKQLRDNVQVTSGDKKIERQGSNNHIKLITDYANTSPEEAFAEYYSFYNLNKKSFDDYIKTNNDKYLKKITAFHCPEKIVPQPIERVMSKMMFSPDDDIFRKYNDIYSRVSEKGNEISYEFISPWKTSLTKLSKKTLSSEKIKFNKDIKNKAVPPIITYIDNGKDVIIDGVNRNEVMRMNKKNTPALRISKELYFKLREGGLNDIEISKSIYTKNRNNKLKVQLQTNKKIQGLIYRNEILPIKQIKENLGIIKMMKKICDSDELRKALELTFN